MSIGGVDVQIAAPPDVLPGEVIIRYMRQVWPGSYFQDADSDDYHPIGSPRVLIQGGRCREFFIFASEATAETWHRDGATPDNQNSMLHFLIEELPRLRRSPRHITMVCDELTSAIADLVANLRKSLRGSRRPKPKAA